MLQRQRAYAAARDAGARLKTEVAERTRELRDANALLQSEVDERRRTEARLRATQNELLQAGKLAALGQMSAAIAHEINQPLAAIRTFMASTKIYLQRGDGKQVTNNLDLIDGLAERMAKITTHLKTFARKSEPGRPEPVQVARAIEGALFLIESQIKAGGVRLDHERRAEPAGVGLCGAARAGDGQSDPQRARCRGGGRSSRRSSRGERAVDETVRIRVARQRRRAFPPS